LDAVAIFFVIPAQAGIQYFLHAQRRNPTTSPLKNNIRQKNTSMVILPQKNGHSS
jgi:hypothetical protein